MSVTVWVWPIKSSLSESLQKLLFICFLKNFFNVARTTVQVVYWINFQVTVLHKMLCRQRKLFSNMNLVWFSFWAARFNHITTISWKAENLLCFMVQTCKVPVASNTKYVNHSLLWICKISFAIEWVHHI